MMIRVNNNALIQKKNFMSWFVILFIAFQLIGGSVNAEHYDECKDDTTTSVLVNGKYQWCVAAKHYSNRYLCDYYQFKMHCLETCDSCQELPSTQSQRFEKKYYGGHDFGAQLATTVDATKIFVPEIDYTKGKTYLNVYHKSIHHGSYEYKYHSTVQHFDYTGSYTKLAVSNNGENVAFAHNTNGQQGEIHISHGDNYQWSDRGSIKHSGKEKFGFLVDISDDGYTVMVADKYDVYVYEYKLHNTWHMRSSKTIPNLSNKPRVVDASITPDGKILVVALTKPNQVKFFKWKNNANRWQKYGNIKALDNGANGLFTSVKLDQHGKRLFTGTSSAYDKKGAVLVFDRYRKYNPYTGKTSNRWELRYENNGIIIKGTRYNDKVGRQISVSYDGNCVAWASSRSVGAVRWVNGKWHHESFYSHTKKSRLALDSSGQHLVIYDNNELKLFVSSYH